MALTTTKGIPYPQTSDNNDTPANFLALCNWLDPVLGSRTSAEITALAGAALWTGRRHYDSTLGYFRYYNGSAWLPEQNLVLNDQTGTTYTLVMSDMNQKFVTLSNASAITVTVPTNASVAFPIGSVINFMQKGAGQVTFSSSATLRSSTGLKIRAQYGCATLVKIATDEWSLSGDVVA